MKSGLLCGATSSGFYPSPPPLQRRMNSEGAASLTITRHGPSTTLADAILDRVIHNAYRIELAGESMRKRRMLEPST